MMNALNVLIESHELSVDCRHCGWVGSSTLEWLSTHRDMNCPTCNGVIVLNTTERRREIATFRRQALALHEQLTDTIPVVLRPLPAKPRLQLGIADLYGGSKWHPVSDSRNNPRIARPRR